jgi:hypothetical protein
MKPRLTYATALAGMLCLTLSASALAWRRPTKSERRAITRVAAHAPHTGGSRVTVGNIRISTVGPWASAEVTIYVPSPDNATDILHRVHGRWTNASVGTSGEQCVMPRADQQNLGFGDANPCGH